MKDANSKIIAENEIRERPNIQGWLGVSLII